LDSAIDQLGLIKGEIQNSEHVSVPFGLLIEGKSVRILNGFLRETFRDHPDQYRQYVGRINAILNAGTEDVPAADQSGTRRIEQEGVIVRLATQPKYDDVVQMLAEAS